MLWSVPGQILSVLFAIVLTIAAPSAQASPLLETSEFAEMLATDFAPADALRFAVLAEAADDPAAAITALEQSLRRHPGTQALHDRLAELYTRVGNAALADHHSESTAPANQVSATEAWGRVSTGIARDSNPTFAQSSNTVRIFDAANNAFLDVPGLSDQPDGLATVSLELNATHKMSQSALLAAEVRLETERYFTLDDLDTVSASIVIGPWLGPGKTASGEIVFRPYLVAGAGLLDGQPYYSTIGGGAELRYDFLESISGSLNVQIAHTDYKDEASDTFNLNDLDNIALTLSTGLAGYGPFDSSFAVSVSGGAVDANAASERYFMLGVAASAAVPIAAVERLTSMPLVLQLGTSATRYRYRGVDPDIDPTRKRKDLWLTGDGVLSLGLTDMIDLSIGADFVRRFSNVAVFDTENLRIYTELGWRF